MPQLAFSDFPNPPATLTYLTCICSSKHCSFTGCIWLSRVLRVDFLDMRRMSSYSSSSSLSTKSMASSSCIVVDFLLMISRYFFMTFLSVLVTSVSSTFLESALTTEFRRKSGSSSLSVVLQIWNLADLRVSISWRLELNQRCFLAYSHPILSLGFFFSSLAIRSFTIGCSDLNYSRSKSGSLWRMLSMVSPWYSEAKGVAPTTISQRVTPTAQLSTFSVQPPPSNISGALQQRVPALVSICSYLPLSFMFLLTPKSIILNRCEWWSQRMLPGLMSRWQMLFLWIYSRAQSSLQNTDLRSSSLSPLVRCGQGKYSMTRWHLRCLELRKSALYSMMESCLSWRMLMKLVFRQWKCQSSIFRIFTANTCPVTLCTHFFTTPCAPSPRISCVSNVSSKVLRFSSGLHVSFFFDPSTTACGSSIWLLSKSSAQPWVRLWDLEWFLRKRWVGSGGFSFCKMDSSWMVLLS